MQLGVVVAAHGLNGAVKVKTFTQRPEDLAAYGPLFDATGTRCYEITNIKPDKLGARIVLKGVTNRNAAEAMAGVVLCVSRAALPPLNDGPDNGDDYYHADLIGMAANTPAGDTLGTVDGVYNFGAGDVLDIAGEMIAFIRENVPDVDVVAGCITVIMPTATEARRPEEQNPKQQDSKEESKKP